MIDDLDRFAKTVGFSNHRDLQRFMAQVRMTNATKAVIALEQGSDEEQQAWFDDNREAIDLEMLKAIVLAAMCLGVANFKSETSEIRQAEAIKKKDQIAELWAAAEAKGQSKNKAAPIIGKKVGLAESSTRKELQKIKKRMDESTKSMGASTKSNFQK